MLLRSSALRAKVRSPHHLRELILDGVPKIGRPHVEWLQRCSGGCPGARRPALHLDDDAEALDHHLHHPPRTSPLTMGQFGPHTLPVERAVALPRQDEVARLDLSARRRPLNPCVATLSRLLRCSRVSSRVPPEASVSSLWGTHILTDVCGLPRTCWGSLASPPPELPTTPGICPAARLYAGYALASYTGTRTTRHIPSRLYTSLANGSSRAVVKTSCRPLGVRAGSVLPSHQARHVSQCVDSPLHHRSFRRLLAMRQPFPHRGGST